MNVCHSILAEFTKFPVVILLLIPLLPNASELSTKLLSLDSHYHFQYQQRDDKKTISLVYWFIVILIQIITKSSDASCQFLSKKLFPLFTFLNY